ncbi:high-potential iron-sulfur protein [Steroidobacter agaridevorans]|uniref:high-potential iron-sulfur protein n=1 Tax=Steroidobacter agaridevorans TaxID=2695856 RepID=UPI0013288B4A|nr:high-potential iron-sulfur protein [Steroidobacter agaridevorans]GFE85248.1 hypothetical protein GCM10011488_02020 [Steroidobacter agaridevorans]
MASCGRRKFITVGLRASVWVLAGSSVRAACVDPDELSSSVQSMRESLEYTEMAAEANESCRHCSFFKLGNPEQACAPCEVLASAVSAAGHCMSWTKRS